jgi:signal transduction histidine kinase
VATLEKIEVKPGFYMDTIFETIQNPNFPVVITDANGLPRNWKDIDVPWQNADAETLERVKIIAEELDRETPPIPFEFPGSEWGPDDKPVAKEPEIWHLHYGESALVRRLSWLPFVALGVTALFVTVGYAGFRHIKNSEQRSIWAGMARETAHQLGTPLSSLYGWLELLKAEVDELGSPEDKARFAQILSEMDRDTHRLNKIASRFSLIGSTPELRPGKVGDVIGETAAYLRSRLPSDIEIIDAIGDVPIIPLNRELLGWAFENLFKNAADAMDGQGGRIDVSSRVDRENGVVDIQVRDNGKGILPHEIKQIFLPGYSTKKRGWGLGLAFVKRIVEDYHNGRIGVKESVPGQGTTFVIALPLVPATADKTD